jgi:predicted O-methyltransferase YrrM
MISRQQAPVGSTAPANPAEGGVASKTIEGQLNARERELVVNSIIGAAVRPKVAIEVGTWLGGGSTLHILRALERNGEGHLWGVEADRSIYDRMLANLRAAVPEALHRFTPLFGFSQNVIPEWIAGQPKDFRVDFAFLDGGNNPMEQIIEFRLLDPHVPVGGQIMAHDVKLRKGKWFAPYISRLDNWRTQIHDISTEGLLHAVKTAPTPSAASLSAAQRHLVISRLHPVEVAAAVLPRAVCGFILGLLPGRASRRLSDGR